MKFRNIFLIAAFSLILALPVLDNFFDIQPVKELFEKRKPQEMPLNPESWTDLKSYPKKFEGFFNDNYGFRKTLITWHSKFMDKVFDESPSARVAIGKDDWLYFNNYNSLLDAQGQATISDELIERGVEAFGKNWQELRSRNIDYLVIIAADKGTVYPEFLPDYIKPNPDNHRIDKFLNALKKKYPDFPILDLRPTLKKAKEKEIVYHKTDTHWNKRGAHYGYVEIMKMLAKKDPRFIAHSRKNFTDKADEYVRGDISDIMGVENTNLNYDLTPNFAQTFHTVDVTNEEKKKFHKPILYVNDNKDLPILFGYHDSYFADLYDYTAWHFSRSFFINEYPCHVNLETIKKYRANVVMHEFWEGRIEVVLDSCKSNLKTLNN